MAVTNYYVIGPDVQSAPYSGQSSVESIYGGQVTTVAQTLAGAQGDTLEIVLCEVPAGTKVFGVMWAISAVLAASNLTAKFALRAKATNAIQNSQSNAGSFGDAFTVSGSATPDVATLPLNGATITVTGQTQGSATTIPTAVEGLNPAKSTLQQTYQLSIIFTSSVGSVSFPAGVTIWAGVEGQFVGTL